MCLARAAGCDRAGLVLRRQGAMVVRTACFPIGAFAGWRSATENGAIGGDGGNSFEVSANAPGDISLLYREQTSRGIKPALKKNDSIAIRLDDKKQSTFDDTRVTVGVDADGIPVATVGLPGGYSAEVVRAMREATSLLILSEDPRTRKQVVVQKFSLAGFSANFLKLSEWCGFDPNKLKTS
jgi:hypothetical protein